MGKMNEVRPPSQPCAVGDETGRGDRPRGCCRCGRTASARSRPSRTSAPGSRRWAGHAALHSPRRQVRLRLNLPARHRRRRRPHFLLRCSRRRRPRPGGPHQRYGLGTTADTVDQEAITAAATPPAQPSDRPPSSRAPTASRWNEPRAQRTAAAAPTAGACRRAANRGAGHGRGTRRGAEL
jgi:hypothetical protein